MDIKALAQQHEAIMGQMNVVRVMLELPDAVSIAVDLELRLDRLSSAMTHHLALEDREFYPALLASANPTARETAERFFVEMGHLRRLFANYRAGWRSDKDIQSRFQSFVDETHRVFSLVEARIKKENEVLFPLWEQAANGPMEKVKELIELGAGLLRKWKTIDF